MSQNHYFLSGQSDFVLGDTSNSGIQMIWPRRFPQGPQNPPSSNHANSYWESKESAHQHQQGIAALKKHIWKCERLLFAGNNYFWRDWSYSRDYTERQTGWTRRKVRSFFKWSGLVKKACSCLDTMERTATSHWRGTDHESESTGGLTA